jgi:hypothetical protein
MLISETDFSCDTFFQVLLSAIFLFVELLFPVISRYKESQQNLVTPFFMKFTYLYQAKYSNTENATNEFYQLYNVLLCEDGIKVLKTYVDREQILYDNMFEMSILFEFELNNQEILDKICNQFNDLTTNLDILSQT